MGNRSSGFLGIDLWICCNQGYTLLDNLIDILNINGYITLNGIADYGCTSFRGQGWLKAEDVGIQGCDIEI